METKISMSVYLEYNNNDHIMYILYGLSLLSDGDNEYAISTVIFGQYKIIIKELVKTIELDWCSEKATAASVAQSVSAFGC